MKSRGVITVIVEKTGTGFSAYANEIEGLTTVGESIGELKSNFNEVFYEHIEYLREIEELTDDTNNFDINYVIDLSQFFEYFSVLNKSAFAEHYVKMNASLFRQYTKGLAPLSSEKLQKISDGLKSLADEINNLNFSISSLPNN
ncbi:type II toxin-antitoxin system HicB family antitoxin [Flavobacterium sp.]|uniref:type II toxin-antitoxin system HicB family antitoxin n=1 Tax=Flavobacterium sp. TaxID=239 RepID=UPI0040342392